MGQIIRLSTAPVMYPDACRELNAAEQAALLAIRWWLAALRRNEDALPHVAAALRTAGIAQAAPAFDDLMSAVAGSGRRSLTIHPPGFPALAPDEAHLLHAAALVQRGDCALAERTLCAALLSAAGAAAALEPLQAISSLFSGAHLKFRRRAAPRMVPPEGIETWTPMLLSELGH